MKGYHLLKTKPPVYGILLSMLTSRLLIPKLIRVISYIIALRGLKKMNCIITDYDTISALASKEYDFENSHVNLKWFDNIEKGDSYDIAKCFKGIFPHETALYLHGMTDRTPIRYTMTFPFGYNNGSVKKQGIIAKLSTVETYGLGIITVSSPSGNPAKVYDIERTLCDIVKARHRADIQVINQAMRTYASSKNKDIAKLMNYADQLRVKPKVLKYMEVLL